MKTALAMVLEEPGGSLVARDRELHKPATGELLLEVLACGVCRTDLHLLDGELPGVTFPIVPGHQVVGRIVETGPDTKSHPGAIVGVAWLGSTCGGCAYCRRGQENLCDAALFHGYQIDGGYAGHMLVDERYSYALAADMSPVTTAPLLCAGLIGYRTLRMAGDARRVGIYGFGAAAHIVTQVAVHEDREIYAFTRDEDAVAQAFALTCGATWAGGSSSPPPVALDAALIFAPVGALIPKALRAIRKGGVVVCGGIHMSEIPAFPYADLWGERQIRSVANLTRSDGTQFLELASRYGIDTQTHTYRLEEANRALADLRSGAFSGSAVLVPPGAWPESQHGDE
jgi:propanol-preferring alcohol dehydrogenase